MINDFLIKGGQVTKCCETCEFFHTAFDTEPCKECIKHDCRRPKYIISKKYLKEIKKWLIW